MTPVRRSRRLLAANLALLVLALGLMSWVLWRNRALIAEVLERRPDGGAFALALGLYLVGLLATFGRWYLLVRILRFHLGLLQAVRLGFVGNVFNLVLPGSVGGDVVKAAYLLRDRPRPGDRTAAVASILLDRLLGMLGLFTLATLTGAFLWPSASRPIRLLIAVVALLVLLAVAAVAAVTVPATRRALAPLLPRRGRLGRLVEELLTVARVYRSRAVAVGGVLGLTLATHLVLILAFHAVGQAFFGGGAPPLEQDLVIVPLVISSTAVPLPFAALGFSEQVAASLFALAGHPGGAVTMMGYRALIFAGGIVSLLVYSASAGRIHELGSAELDQLPARAVEPAAWDEAADRGLDRGPWR